LHEANVILTLLSWTRHLPSLSPKQNRRRRRFRRVPEVRSRPFASGRQKAGPRL